MNKVIYTVALLLGTTLTACTSAPPVTPEADNVKVSREKAKDSCHSLGSVEGRTNHVRGGFKDALEDLKLDAARKGANYVEIKQTGALGQSVRGEAFLCR